MSAPAIIRWDQAYNRNGDRDLPRDVVNVIRTYMDNHTLEGWVKAETLAQATGLKVRQVRRHIADNVEAGWLEITAMMTLIESAQSCSVKLLTGDGCLL